MYTILRAGHIWDVIPQTLDADETAEVVSGLIDQFGTDTGDLILVSPEYDFWKADNGWNYWCTVLDYNLLLQLCIEVQ